jgi:hypothetical protein
MRVPQGGQLPVGRPVEEPPLQLTSRAGKPPTVGDLVVDIAAPKVEAMYGQPRADVLQGVADFVGSPEGGNFNLDYPPQRGITPELEAVVDQALVRMAPPPEVAPD